MKPWMYFAIPVALFLAGTFRIGAVVYEYKKAPEWEAIELRAKTSQVKRRVVFQEPDEDRVRRFANIAPDVKITKINGVHVYQLEKEGHYINIVVPD